MESWLLVKRGGSLDRFDIADETAAEHTAVSYNAGKASISCAVLRAVRITPISVADAIPVQSP